MTRWTSLASIPLFALAAACGSNDADSDATGGAGGSAGESGSAGEAGSAGDSGAAGTAGAPSCEGTQSSDEKFSAAMQVLREALESEGAPGGAIAVVKDGEIVEVGVAGSKRQGTCDPITPDTLFRAGWVTGTLTSIATLDAVEDGRLALTAPITDAIPSLSVSHGDAGDITLHHLLTGTSMYAAESMAGGAWTSQNCESLADSFANATGAVIQAPPGSMHNPMPVNLEMAGLALENADGRPFVEAVTDRVLLPLGMGGAFDADALGASDHALGHEGGERHPDADACDNRTPSEQYHGSIRDLAKLAAYLTGGGAPILEDASRGRLVSEQAPSFWGGWHSTYGMTYVEPALGVFDADYAGFGFWVNFRIYQQAGLAVITVVNLRNDSLAFYDVTSAVARIYDSSVPEVRYWEKIPPDPASLPSLAGTYVDELGWKGSGARTIEVRADTPGELTGDLVDSSGTSVPVTFGESCCPDNFELAFGAATYAIRFWRDASGNGDALSLLAYNGPPFFRVPAP